MIRIKKIKDSISNLILFLSDYCCMIRCHSKRYVKSNLERDLLLLGHALEKGMTFENKKDEWGKDKCILLCNKVERYVALAGHSKEIVKYVVNIINNYKKDLHSSKDPKLNVIVAGVLDKNHSLIDNEIGSVKSVVEPMAFDKEQIIRFFASRSSVRSFSTDEVTDKELKQAVSFARYTPTACNRQSSRIYVFRNQSKIEEILINQLGSQGWCDKAKALIVLTGVQSYFGGNYERHQVFIDGGLFAMNLAYGLHLQHIAFCFKMYVRDMNRDKEFRKICGIPGNEQPIVLILCGHYKDSAVNSTASKRFDVPLTMDGSKIL